MDRVQGRPSNYSRRERERQKHVKVDEKLKAEIYSWHECKRCPLHEYAFNVVLFDGQIPAETLFVGEAPGKTEDLVGRPFVGRSGLQVLRPAIQKLKLKSWCITNIVGCIPWYDPIAPEDNRVRKPSPDEANACLPRVDLMLKAVDPKQIVLLGKTAQEFFRPHKFFRHIPVLELYHPAYLLRNGGYGSRKYKEWYRTLEKFIKDGKIPKTQKERPRCREE